MVLDFLVSLLIPEYCFSCRKMGRYICKTCADQLEVRENMVSYPSGFACHVASFRYGGVLKKALRGAKYFSVRKALVSICKYVPWGKLCQEIKKRGFDHTNAVIVPVPLHPKKQKERGFNQAEIIAREMGRHTNIPLVSDSVVRTIYTQQQARLNRAERETNLRGAFGIRSPTPLKNKNIILVDDVWTTGSTIREVARVIRQCNVRDIMVITLAR